MFKVKSNCIKESVYIDEGISATDTRHRSGFNQMVQDALDGKIDLIVTKSVSRFARNTVDSLHHGPEAEGERRGGLFPEEGLLYVKSSEEYGKIGILRNSMVFSWCLKL